MSHPPSAFCSTVRPDGLVLIHARRLAPLSGKGGDNVCDMDRETFLQTGTRAEGDRARLRTSVC